MNKSKIEIRKLAIKYCESLTELSDNEKEIAYLAYIKGFNDSMNYDEENDSSISDGGDCSTTKDDHKGYGCDSNIISTNSRGHEMIMTCDSSINNRRC